MYGGLFGDLPAAKGQEVTDESCTQQTETSVATKSSDVTKDESSTSTQRNDFKKPSSTAMFLLPPAIKKAKVSNNATSRFSQTIGAAGTSMAFVPATVKRKQSRFAKVLETPKVVSASEAAKATMIPTPEIPSVTLPSFFSTTTSMVHARLQSGPIDIHASQQQLQHQEQQQLQFQSLYMPQNHLSVETAIMAKEANVRETVVEEDEDDPVEITDPYDPYVPNDLLQYWDRQALIKEQQQLEQETRQALEHQKILREQLEHERQELQKQGNLVQLAGGLGRGRGRGVSNLPAWLVAKQQEEGHKEDALGEWI